MGPLLGLIQCTGPMYSSGGSHSPGGTGEHSSTQMAAPGCMKENAGFHLSYSPCLGLFILVLFLSDGSLLPSPTERKEVEGNKTMPISSAFSICLRLNTRPGGWQWGRACALRPRCHTEHGAGGRERRKEEGDKKRGVYRAAVQVWESNKAAACISFLLLLFFM